VERERGRTSEGDREIVSFKKSRERVLRTTAIAIAWKGSFEIDAIDDNAGGNSGGDNFRPSRRRRPRLRMIPSSALLSSFICIIGYISLLLSVCFLTISKIVMQTISISENQRWTGLVKYHNKVGMLLCYH
jgi:hypothetical protein